MNTNPRQPSLEHRPTSSTATTVAGILLTAFAVCSAAALAARFFTLNLTPSLPRGIYLLRPDLVPRRGDIVQLPVPESVGPLVQARHYLPPGARLLKVVFGLSGDDVCVTRSLLSLNGANVAAIRHADSFGRYLKPNLFCDSIPTGQAFVATAAPLSFDSRYFGVVPVASLTVAMPLWTF
jgi:conjugative transfer signal peptidase TraF